MTAALGRLVTRGSAALRLTARTALIRGLAATGDPVAELLAAVGRDDVYAVHERIRARGPLTASRLGPIAVTSHALCTRVLRDPAFGIRDSRGRPAGDDPVATDVEGVLAGSFLELDPPDHTRLRRLAAPAFRPKLIRGYAQRIEDVAERLLDRAEEAGSVDLIRDVATPLPISVISDLLGIPDADTSRFAGIGLLVGQALDGVTSVREADALRAAGDELTRLFTRLVQARRASPTDDVIGLLAAAEDGGQLTGEELLATCGLLLVAGFETTVNLVGNGVAALLADRTRWDRLGTEPGFAERVVEETLRHDPPVQLTARVVQCPTELAGRRLPVDTQLLVDLAAANRDPAVYRDPHRFDPDRVGEPEHLAFSSGIHYCLGAPLARLEAAIAFRALARRFPRLQPAPGAVRRAGATIRGYRAFPVHTGTVG